MANFNNKHNEDDISNEKILEIYFDALQKCKNKYDKMRVSGKMLKYIIQINYKTDIKSYALES